MCAIARIAQQSAARSMPKEGNSAASWDVDCLCKPTESPRHSPSISIGLFKAIQTLYIYMINSFIRCFGPKLESRLRDILDHVIEGFTLDERSASLKGMGSFDLLLQLRHHGCRSLVTPSEVSRAAVPSRKNVYPAPIRGVGVDNSASFS